MATGSGGGQLKAYSKEIREDTQHNESMEVKDDMETKGIHSPIETYSTIEGHIQKLKQILLEGGSDRDITKKLENIPVKWDVFANKLQSIEQRNQLQVISEKFERDVQVYKDGSDALHSQYKCDDSILLMATRRTPSKEVVKILSHISKEYRSSKEIFEVITNISIENEEWLEVHKKLDKIDSDEEFMRKVCLVRHTWREDNLLSVTARRDAPLGIVKRLLKYAPETITVKDTPAYNWIPLVYSLAYNAIPEVIKELTPNHEFLSETGLLFNKDVYDLTPLHWALFYGATSEVIKHLVDADKSKPKKSLLVKNSKGKRPLDVAITETSEMKIIEAVLPEGNDLDTVEKTMVRSIASYDGEYEVSARAYYSLAQTVEKKGDLQRVLIGKSLENIPTFMMISEFYMDIILIYTFEMLAKSYLLGHTKLSTSGNEFYIFLLMVGLLYNLVREVNQVVATGLSWIGSPWNWFDVSCIVLTFSAAIDMLSQGDPEENRTLLLITVVLLWSKLLLFLRSTILPFAIFVNGLLETFKTLTPFTFGVVIVLCAFANLYVIEGYGKYQCAGENSESDSESSTSFCGYSSAFQEVYSMFVGGIEIQELSLTNEMFVISGVFGYLVTILLLNIVIAIVSDSWAKVYEEGKVYFWFNRLEFLSEMKGYEYIKEKISKRSAASEDVVDEKAPVDVMSNNTDTQEDDSGQPCLNLDPYGAVVKICNLLWPRPDFWGHFDHIIDRVCSTKPLYGSFLWQFLYEWKQADGNTRKRLIMGAKGVCLIVFFGLVLFLWFIAGLLTFGLLWPHSIRRKILIGS